jgi:hypothetical protein
MMKPTLMNTTTTCKGNAMQSLGVGVNHDYLAVSVKCSALALVNEAVECK